MAPVVMVDGTGILHPRRSGIACHLGVVAGTATIGVTKKLLCGQVDIKGMQPLESRPVVLDDDVIGVAIRPTSGSLRPLFVSPGSGVDLASAERIVSAFLCGQAIAPAPLLGRSLESSNVRKTATNGKLLSHRKKAEN